ncbi:hypothetical protein D3C75_1135780 [compost metagenome]
MIGFNDPAGVPQNDFRRLRHLVRRKPSLGPAQVHGAPCRVKADAELSGGADFLVDQLSAHGVRETIKVIGSGRAAGLQQFAEAYHGTQINILRPHVAPYFVQRQQPVEQLAVLGPGDVPGKGLV